MSSKTKRWVGSAQAKAQVWAFQPPVTNLAPTWKLTCNGKTISVVSDGTPSNAATLMQAAWSQSQEPEIQEISASVPTSGNPADNPQGTGTNEINAVYITGVPTGGSFQLNWIGAQTEFLSDPVAAPTTTNAAISGVLNGAYKYAVTFVNTNPLGQLGETKPSTEASITVTSSQVLLSAIPTGPTGTIGRRIYRTAAGGASGSEELVTTIWDNVSTVYLDNVADGSLGAAMPTANTTGIPYNATSEQMQNALQGLLTIKPGGVVVFGSGTTASPWLVQWVGEFSGEKQPLIAAQGWSFNYATVVPPTPQPRVVVTEIQQGIPALSPAPSDGATLLLTATAGVPFYVTSEIAGKLPVIATTSSNVGGTVTPPSVTVNRTGELYPQVSIQQVSSSKPSIQVSDGPRTTPGISVTRATQGVTRLPETQQFYLDTTPLLTTPSWGLGSPFTATATGVASSGNVVGNVKYVVTFYNSNGQTAASAEAIVVPNINGQTGADSQSVSLTNIPLGPTGTTGRKIYRTNSSGISGTELLLTTIADNTSQTYTDNALDSALGAAAPIINTTGNPPSGGSFTLSFPGTAVAPPAAPALVLSGSSSLVGTYLYCVTYETAFGETLPGPEAAITTVDQNIQVTLPIGPTIADYPIIARKLYRTHANGLSGSEQLVTTINDNTTTVYLDSTADGSLGAAVPTANTTSAATPIIPSPPGAPILAFDWLSQTQGPGAPTVGVDSGQQLTAPAAPTVATGPAGVLTGTYLYKITFVNANGETNAGTESASVSPSSQEVSLSAIPLGGTGCTARNIYRTAANGATGTEKFLHQISDNTTTTYTDNIADGSLGANAPSTNTTGGFLNGAYWYVCTFVINGQETSAGGQTQTVNPTYDRVDLTNIPTGPALTTARKIYRTIASGSQAKLVATISDNTTTSYTDNVTDGSLGANVPTVNGTASTMSGNYIWAVTFVNGSGETTIGTETPMLAVSDQRVILSNIPLGPTGTTARKIYRTPANGGSGTEKLAATLSDNTTTTFTDFVPDTSLGAFIPSSNTAGISPPGAPMVAVGSSGSLTGAYLYEVTFQNANGETKGGAESISVSPSSQQVNLTAIPLGPTGTTGRRLYRTSTGGASGTEKLLHTIADNTTTTYTDNTADGSLGATIPSVNTTGIAYNASASAVQTAFQALATVGSGNALVSGSGTHAAPYTLEYTGTLAGPQPLLSGNGAWIVGTCGGTVTETQVGVPSGSANEIQSVGFSASSNIWSGSTFVLLLPAPNNNMLGVGPLPYNASASVMLEAIQTALGSLGTASLLYSIQQTNNGVYAGTAQDGQPIYEWMWEITYIGQLGAQVLPQARIRADCFIAQSGTITGATWVGGTPAAGYAVTPAIPNSYGVYLGGASTIEYKWSYGSSSDSVVPQRDDAPTLQASLSSLATVGSGNVTVTDWTDDNVQIETAFQITFSGPSLSAGNITVGAPSGLAINIVTSPGTVFIDPFGLSPGVYSGGTAGGRGVYPYGTPFILWTGVEPGGDAGIVVTVQQDALASGYAPLAYFSANATTIGYEVERGNPSSGRNETQVVSLSVPDGGMPTGGYFNLAFEASNTTNLPYDASASQIQTALQALGTIGSGNCTATGNGGGPWTVVFTGTLADATQPLLSLTASALWGDTIVANENVAGISGATEVDVVTITNGAGGTFTLGMNGINSAAIPYNATANQVQTALFNVSTIGANNVSVAGSTGGPWTVTFANSLAVTSVPGLSSNGSMLDATLTDTITITGGIGGTFTLGFNGANTTALAYNASAANVQTALQSLLTVGAGNVSVSGSNGGPWTAELFLPPSKMVGDISANGAGLTGSLVETVSVTSVGGTFTLDYNGQTTAGISSNASATTVQSALNALSTIAGGATVTGSNGGPYTVTLSMASSLLVGLLTGSNAGLLGTVTDSVIVSNAAGGTFALSFDGQTTTTIAYNASTATVQSDLSALSTLGGGNVSVSGSVGYYTVLMTLPVSLLGDDISGDASQLLVSATYVVSLTNAGDGSFTITFASTAINVFLTGATGGTFTITYGGQQTAALNYNAAASDLETALASLSNVGAENVTVSGSGSATSPWLILFSGAALQNDVPLTFTTVSSLTPSTATITVETEANDPPPGTTTSAVSYNATSADLQTALSALSTVGAGNVTVTGVSGGPWTITLLILQSEIAYGLLVDTDNILPEQIAQTNAGGPGTNQGIGYPLIYAYADGPNFWDSPGNWADGAQPSAYLPTPPAISFVTPLSTDASLAPGTHGTLAGGTTYFYKVTATNANGETTGGTEGSAETILGAKVSLNGAVTGGNYTLSYNGSTTGNIAYNAPYGTVQSDLQSLASVGSGNCAVTGLGTAASPFIVTFSGAALSNGVPYALSANATGLTPSGDCTISVQNLVQLTLAVSWNEIPNATGYKLYRGTSSNGENVLVTTITSPDQTLFIDDGTYTTTSASPPTNSNAWNTAVGDDVYFIDSDVDCLYNIGHGISMGYSIHGGNGTDPYRGLNYLSVNSLTSDSTYIGSPGLPLENPLGYDEYRPTQLSIIGPPGSAFPVTIGNGNGNGSPFMNFDFGTCELVVVVNKTGTATGNTPAILFVNTNAVSELDLFNGSVGIAFYPGQTSQLETIRQGYQTNINSDTSLVIGAGVTLGTLFKQGGDTLLHNSLTTLTMKGGTLTQDAGTVTTLSIEPTREAASAVYTSKGTGTITTLNIGAGGVFDRSEESQPIAVTTINVYSAQASYTDPHGCTQFTELNCIKCGMPSVFDLGTDITLTRTQN